MEQYTRLGWEYIGYEPTPTEIDEKTLNLLVYVDTFLDKVLKES
jgi:hypothetical protein